jgi:site-specific recombinase XerD
MRSSTADYLAFLAAKGRVPGTLKVVRLDINGFVRWWEEQHQRALNPQFIRAEDLTAWCTARQEAGTATSTINRGLAVLRAYCAWAVSTDRITTIPAEGLHDIPVAYRLLPSLPMQAIEALLQVTLSEKNTSMRLRNQASLALMVCATARARSVRPATSGSGPQCRTSGVTTVNRWVQTAHSD